MQLGWTKTDTMDKDLFIVSLIDWKANVLAPTFYVNQNRALPIFTQSLHFRRCSSLPFFCFGVSSPQYIQAFSLLIVRDFARWWLEDEEVELVGLAKFVLVEWIEAPRIDGDVVLVWRLVWPERGLDEFDNEVFAEGNDGWLPSDTPGGSEAFLFREGWSWSAGSNIFFDFYIKNKE